jgi:predicted translin family RNA/ssDNA-binding protein
MNDLRGSFDAISRIYQQLDEKLSQQGGIEDILAMHRRLREAVFAISNGDLVILLEEIDRAKQALDRLKGDIAGLSSLKEAFKSATLP